MARILAEDIALVRDRARIDEVFEASVASVSDTPLAQFDDDDRLRLGLSMVAERQSELILVSLGEQGFDRRTAERLLSMQKCFCLTSPHHLFRRGKRNACST